MKPTDYFTCPDRPGFLAWGLAVDKALTQRIGLGVLDLPDQDYSSMYEDGLTASETVAEVLDATGFGEGGW